jgi:hypothetical protein
MDPVSPAKLLPDVNLMLPLSPSDVVPVERSIFPVDLVPEVSISTFPLLAEFPEVLPLITDMDPPVLDDEVPATIDTDPPTP